MRKKDAVILCLSVSLLLLLGSQPYGEPLKEPGISFSIFYLCHTEEDDQKTQRFCVSGLFEQGRTVVLVCEKGSCSTKTANTFTDEYGPGSLEIKATRLTGTEKCFAVDDVVHISPIAVVGADSSVVRVIEPKTDESFLSAEIELKARKFASSEYDVDVADSAPDVFGVGNTAFLLFECKSKVLFWYGLPVFVINNNVFPLNGLCASKPPFFFSVKEKLYVSYWATVACCDCGDSNFFVYDLSGESPKLVCHNSDFSM